MLQNWYPQLLTLHNWLRWAVVIAAIVAAYVAVTGWSGGRNDTNFLMRASRPFVGFMDLQFLLGLALYFFASPVVHQAMQNMSAAMKDHDMRFFAVEHTTAMFLALILAHVGSVMARKRPTPQARHRGAAICYLLSLALILIGMPWFRPLLRY